VPGTVAAALGLGAAAVAIPRLGARRGALLALAGLAGWLALAQRLAASAPGPVPPGPVRIDATVCRSEERSHGRRLELCDVAAIDDGPGVPRRISLFEGREPGALDGLRVGTRARLQVRIASLDGRAGPGLRDSARRARRRGLGARASLVHPRLWVALGGPGPTGPDRRAAVVDALRARGRGGALLAALALGDRAGLDRELRRTFAGLGIAHLLAISGLHLGLVAGAAYLAARRALTLSWIAGRGLDPRRGAWLAALATAGGYALLVGDALPVRRAWLFVLLSAGPVWLGRGVRPREVLGAAGLVVLALEPAALFEVGAQLSFAASAALLAAVASPPAEPGSRLRSALREAVRVSGLASAATAPVLAWHGLAPSAVGVAVNVVAVPWTTFVLLPAALGAAAATALGLDPGPAVLVAEGSLAAAEALAEVLPLAAAPGAPHPLAGLLCAGPALWAVRRATPLRAAAAALAAAALAAGCPRPPLGPPPPRLVAFDVGLGDAVLVQGRRAAVLVDAGWAVPGRGDRGRDTVLPGLRALGVDRLDLLIVTHVDADHIGGAASVVAALPTAEVWLPPGAAGSPAAAPLRAAAAGRGTRLRERTAAPGRERRGDLRLRVLWPPARPPPGERNEGSLVVRVAAGERSILLTGDIGVESERALLGGEATLASDWLKVGHHGSRGSSSAAFLARVRPRSVLVSAPCRGRPGLPHPQTLARLRAVGARLWWTGRDGAVRASLVEDAVRRARPRPLRCPGDRPAASRIRSLGDRSATFRPREGRPRPGAARNHAAGHGVQRPESAGRRARSARQHPPSGGPGVHAGRTRVEREAPG